MIIKNVNVIPMTEEIVLRNQTIHIKDGKIESINSTYEGTTNSNDIVIDGTNKYKGCFLLVEGLNQPKGTVP